MTWFSWCPHSTHIFTHARKYFNTHLTQKYLTKYASDLIKPFDGKTLFDKALPTKCTRSACLNSLMPLAKPHPIDMILDKNFNYFAWITKLQMKHVWNSLQSKNFWHFHEFKNSWFYKKTLDPSVSMKRFEGFEIHLTSNLSLRLWKLNSVHRFSMEYSFDQFTWEISNSIFLKNRSSDTKELKWAG